WPRFLGLHAFERLGHVELSDLRTLDGAVGATPGHVTPTPDDSLDDTANPEAADVRRGVEVRDQRLKGMTDLVARCGNVLQDQIQQRTQVRLERLRIGVERGAPRLGVAV